MVQGDLPALHPGRVNAGLPRPAAHTLILTLAAHQVDIECHVTALQTLRFGGTGWALVLDKQGRAGRDR
jgi:hypothetical protein